MENYKIIKKGFKIRRFVELIGAVGAVMGVGMTGTSVLYLATSGTVHSPVVPAFYGFLILSLALNLTSVFFHSKYKKEVKNFSNNNKADIKVLREVVDLRALEADTLERDRVYRICARVVAQREKYKFLYTSWNGEMVKHKYTQASQSYHQLNSVVEHVMKMPGFDEARFSAELNLIMEIIEREETTNLDNQVHPSFLKLALYPYLCAHARGDKTEDLVQIETGLSAYLSVHGYTLSEENYREIGNFISSEANESGAAFATIAQVFGSYDYPQVQWSRIKQLINENYNGFSTEYLALRELIDKKVTLENTLIQHQRAVEEAQVDSHRATIISAPGEEINSEVNTNCAARSVGVELGELKKEANLDKHNRLNSSSTLTVAPTHLINYIPHHHLDKWAQLKDLYHKIYTNHEILGSAEFKAVNAMISCSLPDIIKTDLRVKNLDLSASPQTYLLMEKNLDLIVSQLQNVLNDIASRLHREVQINHQYLKMKFNP